MSRPITAKARGFTLTEVMVAMAILSTAVAGALVLMTGHLDAAADQERRLAAGILAENLLVEEMASQAPPEIRSRTGLERLGGIDFAWTLTTAETPVDGMVSIRADIRQEDGEQVIRSLTAYKAAQ